jgi:hypothetical protein
LFIRVNEAENDITDMRRPFNENETKAILDKRVENEEAEN